MTPEFRHFVVLVLFGAGAVLCFTKYAKFAVACVSAGLFVEAF